MKQPWKNKISMIATENDLLKTCIDYLEILKRQGKIYYACVSDSEQRRRDLGSMPDLVVWIKRQNDDGIKKMEWEVNVISIELKSPKGTGRLTGRQAEFVGFLENCIHTHHITNNFDVFKNILEGYLE